MSKDSKANLLRYLSEETRFDGRKLDEFRKIEIQYNVSKTSEGSAKVKVGNTEVIAGIKLELGKPFPDTPDEGALMVGTELLPLSSPDFEAGPPGIDSIEMARVVDRGIRESKAIDYKKLCVQKGEKVWIVNVDICSINNDGNLLDASGIAAIAAIKTAKFPSYDGEKVDYKTPTNTPVPLVKFPIAVTVFKLKGKYFVDPNSEEEKCFDARLTITTIEDGTICALQKGGDAPLTINDVESMVEIATRKAKEIRKNF